MRTTLLFDEIQFVCAVTFCMVPSENTAVAVIVKFVPTDTVGLAGFTIIETRVAAATVTVVEPEIPLRVAVIGVFPTPRPATSPANPRRC